MYWPYLDALATLSPRTPSPDLDWLLAQAESGRGSAIMSRIAAPMVGGMLSAVVLTLLVLLVVYFLWRKRSLRE